MANWDNLTVKCENEDVLKALLKNEALCCREIDLLEIPGENKAIYGRVRNGTFWHKELEKVAKTEQVAIKAIVNFEHDWHLSEYTLIFKPGKTEIIDVKAFYMIDMTTPPEMVDLIEPWAREYDDMERQEKECVKSNGHAEIYYKPHRTTKHFKLDGWDYLVVKEGPIINIHNVKQVISKAREILPVLDECYEIAGRDHQLNQLPF